VRDLFAGVLLTVGVTGLMYLVWGEEAVLPGVAFGLLAAGINAAAVALIRPALQRDFGAVMARWGMGMGLRLAGVGLFVLAVVREPERFPALPTAVAYIGVLLPLLFYEMRLLRR